MSRTRADDYGTSAWRARVFRKRAIANLVLVGVNLVLGLFLVDMVWGIVSTAIYDILPDDAAMTSSSLLIVAKVFFFLLAGINLLAGLITFGRARRWARRARIEAIANGEEEPAYATHVYEKKKRPVKQKPVKTNTREEKKRLEEENYRIHQERLDKALSYSRGRAIIERTFQSYLEEVNALLIDSLHEDLSDKEKKKLQPVSGVCEVEYGKDSNARGTACLIKLTLEANYEDVEKLSMVLETKAKKGEAEESSDEDDYEKESRLYYQKGKRDSIQSGSNELVNELVYRVNAAIGPIWEGNGQAIFLNGELIDEFVYLYEIDWRLPHGMKKKDLPAGFEAKGSIVAKIVL